MKSWSPSVIDVAVLRKINIYSFSLEENGIEQSFALQQISRILNIQQKHLSGWPKDKHSVSYQYITVKVWEGYNIETISKYRSNQ